jgi:hypothetical protein
VSAPREAQLVDTGNSLLAKVESTLSIGTVESPDGQLALLTFRTASTTFTTMASAVELKGWLDLLNGLCASMSKSGLVVARGALPPAQFPQRGPGGRT